jgi:hypothetical protein
MVWIALLVAAGLCRAQNSILIAKGNGMADVEWDVPNCAQTVPLGLDHRPAASGAG